MADIDADNAGDAGDAGDNAGDAGDAGDVVPQVGPILPNTCKNTVFLKVFGGRKRGKYGNLPNSIFCKIFGEPQKKHCVFDSLVWIQSRAQTWKMWKRT